MKRLWVDNQLTLLQSKRREELRQAKPVVYEKSMRYGEKLLRGESIAVVQIQYDYICNMHCDHCSVSSLRNSLTKKMTVEDVKNIAKQADELGLAHIAISGGEPLLFKDLDKIIAAINPEKFYITVDTNGLLLTKEKATWLKNLGVDKMQISLDSLDEKIHDDFRRHTGSYKKALEAIKNAQEAGIFVQVTTVVTPQRLYTGEFVKFLDLMKEKKVITVALFPKLVGEWEGNYSVLLTEDETKYVNSLESQYEVNNHLTKHYGMNIGCLAVKKMLSITQSGDVLPCLWMYFSLGNIHDMPLKDIIKKGMKYFGNYCDICKVSDDREFIDKYLSKTWGKKVPIPIEEIME